MLKKSQGFTLIELIIIVVIIGIIAAIFIPNFVHQGEPNCTKTITTDSGEQHEIRGYYSVDDNGVAHCN